MGKNLAGKKSGKTLKFYADPDSLLTQQAQAHLNSARCKYTAIDIDRQPPTAAEIFALMRHVGGAIMKLIRCNDIAGTDNAMGLLQDGVTRDEAATILRSNPRVLVRPILLLGSKVLAIGYDQETWNYIEFPSSPIPGP